MAAIVDFVVGNGGSNGSPITTAAQTDGNGNFLMNFLNQDEYPGDPVANAIVAGTNSYERWFYMNVVSFAGSSSISNVRFYLASGTPSEDTYCYFGENQQYVVPTAAVSTIATQSIPTALPTTENVFIDGAPGNSLTPGSTNNYTDWIVLQIQTTPSASAGTSLTFNCVYSEIA